MAISAWKYYAVKLIYQAIITGDPLPERLDDNYNGTHIFYEESIVLVHAQSFDHAYTIAERKAMGDKDEYINPYGQTVKWELIDAIDCYWIDDRIVNGIKLFSSLTPVEKEITPSEYLMQKYTYNLNDYDWNYEQTQKRIRSQYVLRYEQFSEWRQLS